MDVHTIGAWPFPYDLLGWAILLVCKMYLLLRAVSLLTGRPYRKVVDVLWAAMRKEFERSILDSDRTPDENLARTSRAVNRARMVGCHALAVLFVVLGGPLLPLVAMLTVSDARLVLQAIAMVFACGVVARMMVVEARRRRRALQAGTGFIERVVKT